MSVCLSVCLSICLSVRLSRLSPGGLCEIIASCFDCLERTAGHNAHKRVFLAKHKHAFNHIITLSMTLSKRRRLATQAEQHTAAKEGSRHHRRSKPASKDGCARSSHAIFIWVVTHMTVMIVEAATMHRPRE